MSLQYKQDDFVLQINDNAEQVNAKVGKYEAYLDAITTEKFEHVRVAIRKTMRFLVSEKYANTEQLAEENWYNNSKLQLKYNALDQYLFNIQIRDKKAASIDLATGSGKSWVIYGIAQLALAEGMVDKVLVLCPSLTIEEELKKKFEQLAGSQTNQQILKELGAVHPAPSIKNANVPILTGDICIENIHAVYDRTGSSIKDSFSGKGQRTLVISDEAHHIYSPDEAATKKWFDFITNPDYGFLYHIGVTGTPYIANDYFHDVIYRYGIKQAIEDDIVKKIDYKLEEADQDKGWDETWHNHNEISKKYTGVLKPITIIVADRIYRTIEIWKELSEYIARRENLSFDEASKKVIWVASGVPSGTSTKAKQEKAIVESIVENPEKTRKENLSKLKTVDEADNPVEWIISVAMLTEGWDVKNVFQIVPHEQRAFNSKLLIAQVLGRGLRVPVNLEQPVYVKINNHEKWSREIKDLYEEVLELENRISYGYSETRKQYEFPLYNLDYSTEQKAVGSHKQSPYAEPKVEKLKPQNRVKQTYSEYSESGTTAFEIEIQDNEPIDAAARQIKLFLKDKDSAISTKWPVKKIQGFLTQTLDELGYDSSFVSRENLSTFKQAFGPMFREAGRQVVRLILKAHNIREITLAKLPRQSFSESSIKRNGYLFYSKEGLKDLKSEELVILKEYLDDKDNYDLVKESIEKYGGRLSEIEFLQDNLIEVNDKELKTVQNLVYVSYEPERKFLKALQANIDLVDAYLKSPDKMFYDFPYSYKPAETGSSHVKREFFNPDFFLKLKDQNNILVVEIKADGDSSPKNRAKYRDGNEHFNTLSDKLSQKGIDWQYHFYFLSSDNYTDFFQAIREGRLNWKSELMQLLDESKHPF